MATTSPDNLWSPDLSSGFDPILNFANMQASVQEALEKRANLYRGTGAERIAFGSQAKVGTVWQDTDTSQQMYIWTGSQWTVHRRQTMNITYKKEGTSLAGIGTGGPSLPEHPAMWMQFGYMHTWTTNPGFGHGYTPTIYYPKMFPNFTGAVMIMQIHVGGAKASNSYALDIVSREGFRVMYPGQPTPTERAFLWMAVGG